MYQPRCLNAHLKEDIIVRPAEGIELLKGAEPLEALETEKDSLWVEAK